METKQRIGVLLLQLGSPDDPGVPAVRRYLGQFLSDPRVIELPRWQWYPVLYTVVLTRRPAQSAAKYRLIWDAEKGFPLKYYTQRLTEKLQRELGEDFVVCYAMRYGEPAIQDVAHQLCSSGIGRMLVVPLYPQYSATTTGSALDALFAALMGERVVPALRVVPPFYDHPAYIKAERDVIDELLRTLPQPPEKIIFSFHGIPKRYVEAGDPYPRQVEVSVRLIAEALGLSPGQYLLAYQSRFGREEWLQPYTDELLVSLAHQGVRRVVVVTPGFVADCLETIDEIGREAKELFCRAGGTELYRCLCLNDHPSWLEALKTIVLKEASGWI